jgi:hypothetical protein
VPWAIAEELIPTVSIPATESAIAAFVVIFRQEVIFFLRAYEGGCRESTFFPYSSGVPE